MVPSHEEKKLDEIKKMLEELNAAKSETATTLAVDQSSKRRLPVFRLKARTMFTGIILLFIFLFIIAAFFFIRSIFSHEGTVVNTVSSFAEQIQDLSSLATSKAYMKAVVEQEDNALFGNKIDMNIPGTKRTTLVIIPGEVIAGVDLSMLTEKDISVNEETKTIHLTLPSAEILQQPSLYFDEAQIYSSEGLLRGEASIEEGYAIAELASNQIINEATEQGLLESAEQQAKVVLDKFMGTLGYKVTIEFQEEE
ncbi:DUF4230 domain-containing protein [Caldibacillus lycopersici]|uniref:DUF4230 domain-containing protein n=1 Tax=Perspicuibacillus lycopersici TaxID=1325689 RepID=A0AAE3ITJ9_9BACI|nr:DUF4230 domain-containing protein [Perspicuibacillus lycopersici]MCU9613353.1 DUF4230 domain-containing protein [Perspicuibacillus lycopersici]